VVELRPRQLYAANLWLRCATRVLVRVASFTASDFATLERHALGIDWHQWIPAGHTVEFRITSHHSRLNHTGAIAERLARAAGVDLHGHDAVDTHTDPHTDPRPDTQPGGPGLDSDDGGDRWDDERLAGEPPRRARFVVRIDRDQFTVSVDSSGEPLHHRGWRTNVAKAPLRPTLAATVLGTIGWPLHGPTPPGRLMLVDPMCGSGTLAIEAALAATGRPPGVGAEPATPRSFAFEQWADFAPGTWASVLADIPTAPPVAGGQSQPDSDSNIVVMASDRDAGAVAATVANAGRAGVGHLVHAHHTAVSGVSAPHLDPPGPHDVAWVLANPPWGRRIGSDDLRNLYATFGNVIRSNFPGWNVGMLVSDRRLAGHTGLPLHSVLRTTSGGQPVELMTTTG